MKVELYNAQMKILALKEAIKKIKKDTPIVLLEPDEFMIVNQLYLIHDAMERELETERLERQVSCLRT